jgi:hypothetical protein
VAHFATILQKIHYWTNTKEDAASKLVTQKFLGQTPNLKK